MCGVIVVDAGRSRPTNLWRDAYIHDHCLGYLHNYLLFYQLPNNNLFTHCVLFSREKPLVKSTPPGSISYHIVFRSIYPKTQSYLATLFLYLFYFVFLQDQFIQSTQFYLSYYRGGIDNPSYVLGCKFLWFVCRCCLHNWGKYLPLLCCIILSSSGNYQRRYKQSPTYAAKVVGTLCSLPYSLSHVRIGCHLTDRNGRCSPSPYPMCTSPKSEPS